MSAIPPLEDQAIEAIIGGDDVPPELAHLATFAARVRALGDEPAPRPALDLVRLLAEADGDDEAASPTPAHARPVVLGGRRALARVAGIGLAAKLAAGVTAAAAGVIGAGAGGVLPGEAGRTVRHAIEAVTPIDLPDRDSGDDRDGGDVESDTPDGRDHGGRVSSDATGESDGGPGVDGPDVAEDAPGTDQPSSQAPDAPSGPATPAPPDPPQSTVPPARPDEPGPPASTPSTVPSPPSTTPPRPGSATTTPTTAPADTTSTQAP